MLTPEQVLDLARRLAPAEPRWLAWQRRANLEAILPEQTTLGEAIELYLADACSLSRAAELVGVTRWDLLDVLQQCGEMQHPDEVRSADEIDDLVARLELQSLL